MSFCVWPKFIKVSGRKLSSLSNQRFLRFLGSGAFNTAVTYLLYLALLQIIPAQTSYAIAFLTGIVLSYGLQRYVVFQTQGRRFGLIWTFLIYMLQFLLGLALVTLWVDRLQLSPVVAPAVSIAITLPMTYVLSTFVFPLHDNC